MDKYYREAWEELTAPGARFSWSLAEVRGISIRVYDSAPSDLLFVWQMSAGYGEQEYLIYEDFKR